MVTLTMVCNKKGKLRIWHVKHMSLDTLGFIRVIKTRPLITINQTTNEIHNNVTDHTKINYSNIVTL